VPRYRLLVAYDGTGFCGWQKQEPPVRSDEGGRAPYGEATPMLEAGAGQAAPRPGRVALRTVQGVLERAVREVVREPVELLGASRTDSGVHAQGQVAAFSCEPRDPSQPAGDGPRVGWPAERGAERLAAAINSRLPEDVLVRAATLADNHFDPIGDVVAKGYSYTLHVGPERPLFDRALVHHVFWRSGLNLEAMAQAAAMMEGEHDFTGFAAAGHGRLSTVRRVHSCRVVAAGPERVRLDVAGSGFLWNMVRIIAGTLLEVGTGRRTLEQVAAALKTGDRRQAGATLPPTGLCLRWIQYAGEAPGAMGPGTPGMALVEWSGFGAEALASPG
jgi:tRNA pseudouridine38-40 synthase